MRDGRVVLISTTRHSYCARVCVAYVCVCVCAGRLVVEEGSDEEKVQGARERAPRVLVEASLALRDSPLETERKHLCEG